MTIPASGLAVSPSFSFKPQGNWSTDHLNASLNGYVGVIATLSK
ncbi:MAG TPA: hypothetical protein VG247_19895 [Pseudonocardiaceae bacterium]|nr:hypothetical protein [Pseudonocardiaceae bacterium]